MKRSLDLLLACAGLVVFFVPMLVIAALILCIDGGPILYTSKRIGRDNVPFLMPKFRTMRQGTPPVATHLLADPKVHTTSLGHILRRTSLDELPQLWSVLRGDMSVVGPRPALFNQYDLIEARTRIGVHRLVPGLTGLAQVAGRDELSIADKVAKDLAYLNGKGLVLDLRILWLTIIKVVRREGVAH